MQDINGKEFDPCEGEKRMGPGALRHRANQLRDMADALDELAAQTDGTLSAKADVALFELVINLKAI
jgi:hypothetical protein